MLTRFIHCLPAVCFAGVALAQAPLPYEPVTGGERLNWVAQYTVGPAMLVGAAAGAGFSTLTNEPREYGTHVKGFAERYGMQLAGIATSNVMEAGLGAVWGEDPRYFRASADASGHARFGARIGHIVKWTFAAPDRNGMLQPAYARYLAISGSSFLANTWEERSEANATHALERTGLGFLTRMAGNAFSEFWPDLKRKMFPAR